MSKITAHNTNPTPADSQDGQSGSFNLYQVGVPWFMTNLFNGSANGAGAPVGVTVGMDIPILNGPAFLPDDSFCYKGFEFTPGGTWDVFFTGNFDNTRAVRCYPAMGVGTRGGGYETWGYHCGDTGILRDANGDIVNWERNNAGNDEQGFPVFDLTDCQQATGLPAFTGSLPQMRTTFRWEDIGDPSVFNVFSDTYWHDPTQVNLLPRDEFGNPVLSLQNTINGMSGRDTAVYNFNIWWYMPPGFNATGGTGNDIASVVIGGEPFDFRVKHETGGLNNFLYIAAIYKGGSQQILGWLYNDLYDWAMEGTRGPGTFLTEIYDHPETQAIIAKMANPDPQNVYIRSTDSVEQRTPAAKIVREPDGTFILADLELGTENWGTGSVTDPSVSGGEGRIRFHGAQFEIDGQVFGMDADAVPPDNGQGGTFYGISNPSNYPIGEQCVPVGGSATIDLNNVDITRTMNSRTSTVVSGGGSANLVGDSLIFTADANAAEDELTIVEIN